MNLPQFYPGSGARAGPLPFRGAEAGAGRVQMDGGGVQDIGLRAGDEDRPPRFPEEAAGENRGHREDALEKLWIQGIIIDCTYKGSDTFQEKFNDYRLKVLL